MFFSSKDSFSHSEPVCCSESKNKKTLSLRVLTLFLIFIENLVTPRGVVPLTSALVSLKC